MQPTNPYATPEARDLRPAAPNSHRGRAIFASIVVATLISEVRTFELSGTTFVRLAITTGLLYATWIGHSWARVTLGVLTFCAVLVVASLGVMSFWTPGAAALGALGLLVVAGTCALALTMGSLLFWSRDLRAYLDTDKFPGSPNAHEERELP